MSKSPKFSKSITTRSRHKLSPQLDVLVRVLSPGLAEWSPSEHKGASLCPWIGPLPEPVGGMSAELLATVARGAAPASWYVCVCARQSGAGLECSFVLRVGKANCPKPRWWCLRTVNALTVAVALRWAEMRGAQ
jgi:hypothetical protein